MVYYASASLELWQRHGSHGRTSSVPSGNLGNVLACVWAREIGLPIGDIVLSTNANRVVPDFLRTSVWQPRASVPTLASAMDVGNPSNMERLQAWFPGAVAIADRVSAEAVDDDEIRATIRRDDRRARPDLVSPHGDRRGRVSTRCRRSGARSAWVLVSTAHPAKFNDIVEPLIGRSVPVPPALAGLLSKPRIETPMKPDAEEFESLLLGRGA